MEKSNCRWTIVCYGNILRSQVLEQYIRHHARLRGLSIRVDSAGIADPDEFPDRDRLFGEISRELNKRSIGHSLHRNPWSDEVEMTIMESTHVFCADLHVKETVLKRMRDDFDKSKVMSFYEAINEGEQDFEDTYDYELKRQDPVRFRNAFDELERIAIAMVDSLAKVNIEN